MITLDKTLERQLKKAGIVDQAVPTPDNWPTILKSINDHYKHATEDRELLTRSLELSTSEMEDLLRVVAEQRDQLTAVIEAIGEALSLFGGLAAASSDDTQITDTTIIAGGLEEAKQQFRGRLEALFATNDDTNQNESQQISGINANLVKLADQLITLLSETADQASLKKELEVARAVQNLLVPTEDINDRPNLQVAGYFQPASECGGDWWGLYDLADGRVLTLVGDATGHGISSAIITGAAKAACDLACNVTHGRLNPSDLFKMMNAAIHDTGKQQIMMTCIAAVFDPAKRQLMVSNAGHHFPYLIRDGQLQPVMAQGQPLGASQNTNYELITVDLAPNDIVILFSDGVTETENAAGEQFSDRKLRAICSRAGAQGARGVRDAVVEALTTFRGDRNQTDDITFVVTSVK